VVKGHPESACDRKPWGFIRMWFFEDLNMFPVIITSIGLEAIIDLKAAATIPVSVHFCRNFKGLRGWWKIQP
jgi:hypothetical protein